MLQGDFNETHYFDGEDFVRAEEEKRDDVFFSDDCEDSELHLGKVNPIKQVSV